MRGGDSDVSAVGVFVGDDGSDRGDDSSDVGDVATTIGFNVEKLDGGCGYNGITRQGRCRTVKDGSDSLQLDDQVRDGRRWPLLVLTCTC